MKYHCFLKGPSITIIEKIAFFFVFSALCQCGGELLFRPPDGFLHGALRDVEHPYGGVHANGDT